MPGGIALSITVQEMAIPRDQLEMDVRKIGNGIRIVYSRVDQKGLETENFPVKFRDQFPETLSIIFGTQERPTDQEIWQKLLGIAASWFGYQYGPSWNVRLTAQQWRVEEGAEVKAEVVLSDDPSWQGIRRLPAIPTCALPIPGLTAASTPKEAETLVDYAWKVHWPIRVAVTLTVGLGTEETFEMSLTYDLPITEEHPNLETLWTTWWHASERGEIRIPPSIFRERESYEAICQKENQSIHVLWRQRLLDKSRPAIREDPGLPPIVLYGAKAELRLRKTEGIPGGLESIVFALYGPRMTIEKIPSTQWAYNAATASPGEQARVLETVVLPRPDLDERLWR
jgi:hypothetical protein